MRPHGSAGKGFVASLLITLSVLSGCLTTGAERATWEQAGLTQTAPTVFADNDGSVLEQSTEALLAAIEAGTGERPTFDGRAFELPPQPDAATGSREHHWVTERRVLAMDILRSSDRSWAGRAALRRARAALRWDVALDAQWSEVDARLVHDALARADAELGIGALPPPDVEAPRDVISWPILPVRITSRFGVREDPFGEGLRRHMGLDLSGFIGQSVAAAADGVVDYAGRRGAYGLHVEVRHANGLTTRYAHLSVALVVEGQRVHTGSIIGQVGQSGRATGPHLHFEVWRDGLPVDPLDALPEVPPAWDRPLASLDR
jgi:murein DD-endopeptidase MepM/ murein hydrolase activator NlpD